MNASNSLVFQLDLKTGMGDSYDYEKVKTYFETMYLSERVQIPLKGILIIGY